MLLFVILAMPPYKELKKEKTSIKPFMPSSPGKEVCLIKH